MHKNKNSHKVILLGKFILKIIYSRWMASMKNLATKQSRLKIFSEINVYFCQIIVSLQQTDSIENSFDKSLNSEKLRLRGKSALNRNNQSKDSSISQTKPHTQTLIQIAVDEDEDFPKKKRRSKCQVLEQFKERQQSLQDKELKWHEQVNIEVQRETDIVKQIYNGLPDEVDYHSKRKAYLDVNDPLQLTYLNPKITTDNPNHTNRFSKTKKSFLSHYREQFRVDGKIAISDNPRAVEKILFQQLSASALASRRWSSITTYRNLLYAAPMAPEFPEYPMYKKKTIQTQRSNSTRQQSKQRKLLLDSTNLPTKDYLELYSQTENSSLVLFSTNLSEYHEILDYTHKMEPSSINKVLKLDEAQIEVQYIKGKASEFRKKLKSEPNWLQEYLQPKVAKSTSFWTPQPAPKSKKQSQQEFYDDVYEVSANVLKHTDIPLIKQQKCKTNSEPKTYLYQRLLRKQV